MKCQNNDEESGKIIIMTCFVSPTVKEISKLYKFVI